MSQHIGIVACSAEGAALCYRTICLEALKVMGAHNHPEITMNSIPIAQHMVPILSDDWSAVSDLLLQSVRKVAQSGARFAICPDNTCHQAFEFLLSRSPIPWLHIAEVVAEEANRCGYRRLGILGTRFLMEGPVYSKPLGSVDIACEIPGEEDRVRINSIIFKELVNGIVLEESRLYFNQVMRELMGRGCDAIVLGCTEIPLLVHPNVTPLPTLDSTRLLARAALQKSLEES